MMDRADEYILSLIKEALAASNKAPVSALLETAKRIAVFRQDFENLWWISLEFCNCSKSEFQSIDNQMKHKFPYEQYKELSILYSKLWIDERTLSQIFRNGRMVATDNVCPDGIYELESRLESIQRSFNGLISTQGMHPLDVYSAEHDNAKARVFLNASYTQFEAITLKIRRRVVDYIADCERQVLYGNTMSNYYDENRRWVQSKLGTYNPSFNEYFASIETHIKTGNQVDFQEALLDIRRILLSFADIVCKANDEEVLCSDGKKRKLTRDRYMNRISYALFEKKGKHAFTEMLNQNLDDLSARISRVNELACKGVHDDISPMEAKQCVIQMYALLGDLIRVLL